MKFLKKNLDKIKDECGIFGIYNQKEAVSLTVLGLHSLQHRGQESAGIVSFKNNALYHHKGTGLVNDVFKGISIEGNIAIGHVRYSTTGDQRYENIQPLIANTSLGKISIAHNGNITNSKILKKELANHGQIFQSTTDTEFILSLLSLNNKDTIEQRFVDFSSKLEGAYSLLIIKNNKLIGVRDPYGFRPLVIGKYNKSFIITSETCALDIIGAKYVRDIEPGEIVSISEKGIESRKINSKNKQEKFCVFEFIYFMRPNSIFQNKSVSNIREKIGSELAKENGVEADVVIPVPDIGIHAAIGYSETSKIPFKQGIIRSHYMGRTFIEPKINIRNLNVNMKLSINKFYIKNKKIILIDDSIVRGTNMKKIVGMLKDGGAKEIHVRIASPPFISPCYYGIDTPTKQELVASKKSLKYLTKYFNCDTLKYISIEGLYKAFYNGQILKGEKHYCDSCFTEEYFFSKHTNNLRNKNH